MSKKAVILLSGGLDSTTCLAFAKSQGYDCYALSLAYGQRHRVELTAAKKVAEHFGVIEHKILPLPMDAIGGSALTDKNIAVPAFQNNHEIPVTYVPNRNLILLSCALGWAEVLQAYDIFIGVNVIEYSLYPDCRHDFMAAFTRLAKLATKAGVEGQTFQIHTPLIDLSKAEIIQLGMRLGVDYGMTISCYQADAAGLACGICDSCTWRRQGFTKANLADPTSYQTA